MNNNKKCCGCGVLLQKDDPTKTGYCLNLDQDYCQRCYKITHYNQLTIDEKHNISTDDILREVNKLDVLVVLVADLFDIEATLKLAINRLLIDKRIMLVATKRDLLPVTLGNEKLGKFLLSRLKQNNISVCSVNVVANHGHDGIEQLQEAIEHYRQGKDVAFIGNANSGKSTLLNALTKNSLTTSYYPGTTLDLNKITMDNYHIYDTPGFTNVGSVLQYIDNKHLKEVIVLKPIKVKTYQVFEDLSFAIGGICKIDISNVNKGSISFYCNDALKIHRGKLLTSDLLWEKHYGELLSPIIGDYSQFKKYDYHKNEDKIDICINGLGFISISGDIDDIQVSVNKQIDVTFRKGMM
ncbi:MAG: GTPase [Erysipelotrichaceae bacterium]